jgi:hypothetical protein
MPVHSGASTALAVNTDSPNQLAGLTYEFVPRNWRRGAAVMLAVSAAAQDEKCTFKIDATSIADGETVPGSNRYPQFPEDKFLVHWAPPGSRLFLKFNGGPNGGLVRWKVDIEPA